MTVPTCHLRMLVLASYLLAVVCSALALGNGGQTTAADHDRVMAMAGHAMPMPAADETAGAAMTLLCQKHCLFGTAALPMANGIAEVVSRATIIEIGIEPRAVSLSIPPPGPPPKSAVI